MKFVVPATYCAVSDQYFTVVQEGQASTSTSQTLLSWPASVTHGSLEQTATRRILHSSVHSLHTVQALSHVARSSSSTPGVIIVFTDGTVAFPEKAEEAVPSRTAGARVINATIDGNKLAIISATKSGLQWTLDLYSLQVTVMFMPLSDMVVNVEQRSNRSAQGLARTTSGTCTFF